MAAPMSPRNESFAPSFSCDQGLLKANSYGALALSFCPIQMENQLSSSDLSVPGHSFSQCPLSL